MNVQSHIADLFQELEEMLKEPDAAASLAELGVNTSIALLAAQGLHSYLKGDKEAAADDLTTAAEEVRSRLATSKRFGEDSN